MKNSPYFLIACVVLLLTGCGKDDVNVVILQSVEYQLVAVDGSGVTGTATFTEDSNNVTEVLIDLDGSSTSTHPAFIRFNSTDEGGPVALTLKACECSVSHTLVSKLDSGNSISYEGLVKFDGHISIHESADDLDTIVAIAEIGSNSKE